MITGILIGLVIGAIVCILLYRHKLVQRNRIDEHIKELNLAAEQKLATTVSECEAEERRVLELNQKVMNLTQTLQSRQADVDQCAEQYLSSKMEVAELQFNKELDDMKSRYTKAEENRKTIYLEILADATSEYQKQVEAKQEELAALLEQLATERSIVESAIEANKRAAAEKDKADFYRLVLSEEDKKEIMELKELLVHFRNPEPLNKVIWKTYYEKPYTDLIGRVVGPGVKTGIYKITNIESGMCYVGQAANIADRWKQHIKRGMGAEAPTQNKLYPAMLKEGVENFTFEIIEECSRADLNEREKYWIEYFQGMEFGYNMRRG